MDITLLATNFDTDSRFPGWCFEYVEERYRRRTAAVADLKQLLDELKGREDLASAIEVPAALLSLIEDEGVVETFLARSRPAQDVWRSLSALRSQVGISRRSVFLWIIGETLLHADSAHTSWRPRDLRDAVFGGAESARVRPLGLADPLGYTFEIIEAMQTLWGCARERLRAFTHFRLVGPWILVGIDQSGVENTVLAYCGGWILRSDGTALAKCGLSPLVLGQDDSCPTCRRLVCHACGYCSDPCMQRQRNDRTQQ